MDVLRHLGTGTLTELVGPGTNNANLLADQSVWSKSDYNASERQTQIAELPAEYGQQGLLALRYANDYTAGINARIAADKVNPLLMPAEYVTVGTTPQPWTAGDSVAVSAEINNGFDLGGGAAAIDAEITSDLYQALLPNDVELLAYLNGFYATGFDPVVGAQNSQLDPTDNYAQEIHRRVAEANSGVNTADLRAGTDARSVNGRYGDIHIPHLHNPGHQRRTVHAEPGRVGIRGSARPLRAGSTLHRGHRASAVGREPGLPGGAPCGGGDPGLVRPLPEARRQQNSIACRRSSTAAPPTSTTKWDGTTRSAYSYPFGRPTRLYLCTTGPQGGTMSASPCPTASPAVLSNGYAGQGYNQEP